MYCLIDQLAGEELHLGIGAACMAMDSVRSPRVFFFLFVLVVASWSCVRWDNFTHGSRFASRYRLRAIATPKEDRQLLHSVLCLAIFLPASSLTSGICSGTG